MSHPPLLVTGVHRSGTSWTGRMLEASGEVVYVNEPMSLSRPPGGSPGVLDAPVRFRFQYIDPTDDEAWRRAFGDTLRLRFHPLREVAAVRRPYHAARGAKYGLQFTYGALRGRRALLDDPNALFAMPWLTSVMGVRSIVVVRDPVSVIGSWKQLGWRPQLDALLAQPALLRDHLGSDESEMRRTLATGDWLEQMCCMWVVAHRFVDRVRGDGIEIVRYEDLATEPLERFRALFEWSELPWSTSAEQTVRAATTASTERWRGFGWSLRGGLSRTAYRPMDSRSAIHRREDRLTPDEIGRVRDRTSTVLARFPRLTADVTPDS